MQATLCLWCALPGGCWADEGGVVITPGHKNVFEVFSSICSHDVHVKKIALGENLS
jgi:hypothetical protein